MKVTAKAVRSGGWWALDIDYGDGLFSQVRRLDQAKAMVADAVALVADVPEMDVDVEVVVDLGAEVRRAVATARTKAKAAEEATAAAAAASREVVARLRSAGLSVRDVGEVLGISHQRVAQLAAHSTPASRVTPIRKGTTTKAAPARKGATTKAAPARKGTTTKAAPAKVAARSARTAAFVPGKIAAKAKATKTAR